jgi:hypothetical protein
LVGIAIGTIGERTVVSCVADKSLNSYILGSNGNLQQTVSNNLKMEYKNNLLDFA